MQLVNATINVDNISIMKETYEIVSEWRKGFAIGRYKSWSSPRNSYEYIYVLLNEKYEPVNKTSYYHKIGLCIHRSLDGRYFVTAMDLYNPITYPGQDSNTSYLVTPEILYVLDENGNNIMPFNGQTKLDFYKYLINNPLQYSIDLGDGLVLYTDKTYNSSSNTFHGFSPLDYILKLKDKDYQRCDEHDQGSTNYDFLRYKSHKNTRENENGEILCGSSIYDINDCNLLFTTAKQIEPLSKFEKGLCKVGIVSDYRDFIVVTSNAKIVKVYDLKDMELIMHLLSNVVEIKNHKDYKNLNKKNLINKILYELPKEVDDFHEKPIEVEVEIEKYLLCYPSEYEFNGGFGTVRYNNKYGTKKLHVIHRFPGYFKDVNGQWYEITKENGHKIDEQIFEMEVNRPNYIKDIKPIVRDIPHEGNMYSIYKFECRPYGFLSKDGTLNYSFDVDNINW